MVGGLIAANSSTILTHLNWGASYLVHDFYRRFISTDADREALRAGGPRRDGRCCSCCSSGAGLPARHRRRTPSTSSCRSAPAPGCSICVRWFWWRVNAWCEVVAMVSSFVVSIVLLVLAEERRRTSARTWRCSSRSRSRRVCWVADGVPRARRPIATCSIDFYRKVRPVGPGLGADSRRRAASAPRRRPRRGDNIPLALLGWVAGLHDDLVGAVHRRQLPLRPLGLRHRPLRRLSRQRAGVAARDAHAVGGLERELTGAPDAGCVIA